MNRIATELAQIPESRRALPLLFVFSVVLMGALCLARLGGDLNYDGEVYISAASKYADEKNTILQLDYNDAHFSRLARFALENRVDLIAIASRVDRRKDIPDLVDYKEIKEFNDKKEIDQIIPFEGVG
jgi:hypothetical protein